jgi:hypothetical protein
LPDATAPLKNSVNSKRSCCGSGRRWSARLSLIQLLDWFSAYTGPQISLIDKDYAGWLRPDQLAPLFDHRRPVPRAMLRIGVRAWKAFTAPDGRRLQEFLDADSALLPELRPVLVRIAQPNITLSPSSGAVSSTLQIKATPGPSGVVTVTAPGAANSPQTIQVNVVTVTPSSSFGSFDTPVNNTSGIAGAIPVTGWALDDVEVAKVDVWREPVGNEPAQSNGLVYIGDAVFVSGARPDVEATYPNAPMNYRGGWGYMLLTNFLPNNGGSAGTGSGTYRLHAIAHNTMGSSLDLGTRIIAVDNAHAAKPFGTIDTPTQGGTASGNAYVNFGWALTQNPYYIPMDGSTITVLLDGVPVGHPTYHQFRSDIANLFPGLANSNGAIGFYYIDTTTLANGVHTISWNVFDNAGRGDGIGSRYFTVSNTGSGNVPAMDKLIDSATNDMVTLQRDFDFNHEAAQLAPDETGMYSVSMEELDRIELQVGATTSYLLVNGESLPLPIGSTLKGGRFYWQAGPGFLGDYLLVFDRPDESQVQVRVHIRPKNYLQDNKR